jgi:hypothetical protein
MMEAAWQTLLRPVLVPGFLSLNSDSCWKQ